MSHVEKLARDVRIFLGVLTVIALVSVVFGLGKDDTDPAEGRSGLSLLTDYGTGCQYLSRNGLTPRLDASGKQMGCRP
jgi:hypothetical protein